MTTKKPKTAKDRAAELLATRDHSEAELRAKLSRYYEYSEVEDAIEYVQANNFMLPATELSDRVAATLGAKKKASAYINEYLKAKGLPPVAVSREEEIQKARELLDSKLAHGASLDYEEEKKFYRLLANRGFDEEIIEEVVRQVRQVHGPRAE